MKREFEILQGPIGPGGFFVELRGHFHAQRLMRPILVEVFDEGIEASLLCEEVLSGRLGGFRFEREMHAFMVAILLLRPRFYPFDLGAESEQPDRDSA